MRMLALGLSAVLFTPILADEEPTPEEKPNPSPKFIGTYGTTAEFRMKCCKSEKFVREVLPQQRYMAEQIAEGEPQGKIQDAFPFWEYGLKPGRYQFSLAFTDAAWANKISIGTVAKFGDGEFLKRLGTLDNRGNKKPVVFTLEKGSKVRIESHANMNRPNAPWFRSFSFEKKQGNAISLHVEDSADTDFDDLIVNLERLPDPKPEK